MQKSITMIINKKLMRSTLVELLLSTAEYKQFTIRYRNQVAHSTIEIKIQLWLSIAWNHKNRRND